MEQIDVYDPETTKFEYETIWIKKCRGQRKGHDPVRFKATTEADVRLIANENDNFVVEELTLFPDQYIKPIFDRDSYTEINYEEDLKMISHIFDDAKVKISTRPQRLKNGKMFWSARYVVQKRRIRANQLLDLIKNESKIPDDYFDLSKYGKGGQFFTLYNDKKYDGEVPKLMPYKDNKINLLDYYATYVEEDWKNYDDLWETLQLLNSYKMAKEVKVEYKDDEDVEMGKSVEIEDIISHLDPKRADHYGTWFKVPVVIINYGIKLGLSRRQISGLVHSFSAKSVAFYEEDRVDKWFESNYERFRDSKCDKKLGRNYLINVCLKEDDPKYWTEKYRYRSYDIVLGELNKECVKVRMNGRWLIFRTVDRNNAEPYYLFDKKGLEHYYENEEQFFFTYMKQSKDGELTTQSKSIVSDLRYFSDTKMKCYDNIVYTPCFDGVMDSKYFNTWDGWNVMKYPKCQDYSKCEVFLTHLKEVWCSGCEVSYKWFLEYLSFIVRGGRSCVGVILRGGQGCGKDCFMTDLLMNRILGQKYCMMTNDPVNQLFGKFNSSLLNKSLVVIAEGGYDLDKCYSNIKDLITNGVLRIEKKFADITPNVNYANFMISTNAYDIIKDGKGRRLGYWSCSDKYKGNKKYFDNFYEAVNDDNAVSAFYNFLIDKEMVYQADIEDLAYLQSTMPQTKLSKDIAVKNTPIVSQFLNGYFKMSKLEEYVKLEKVVKVKRSELYSAYRRFCDKCGYERLKLNLFSAQLLNLHNIECKKNSEYWFIFTLDILIGIKKGLEDLEKEGADFNLADAIIHHNTADFEEDD